MKYDVELFHVPGDGWSWKATDEEGLRYTPNDIWGGGRFWHVTKWSAKRGIRPKLRKLIPQKPDKVERLTVEV